MGNMMDIDLEVLRFDQTLAWHNLCSERALSRSFELLLLILLELKILCPISQMEYLDLSNRDHGFPF
jgi:hypothetical protein